MLRTCAVYTVAVAAGIFAPIFMLWTARTASIGASPVVVAVCVILALTLTSALLASFLPRHWIATTSLVSLPTTLIGCIMFLALAGDGAYYIWLFVGIGSLAASAIAAFLSAKAVVRLGQPDRC